MTDPAKYIVFLHGGCETAVVFPCWINHSNMAPFRKEVVGAGRVKFSFADDKIWAECYGDSVSLKVKSRLMQDAELIEKSLLRT